MADANSQHLSTPTFMKRVKELYPNVQIMPPSFACCSKCQLLGNSIYETRLDLNRCKDTDKRILLQKKIDRTKKTLEEHLAESFDERKYYKQQIEHSRTSKLTMMLY